MKISRSGVEGYIWGFIELGAGLLQRSFLAWSDFSERYTISMHHTEAIGMRLSALVLLLNGYFWLS